MPLPTLTASSRQYPLKNPFRISRGVKTHADTVVVELSDGVCSGFGECTPYPRYGESIEGVVGELNDIADNQQSFGSIEAVQKALKAGAARNALDCAVIDFLAKSSGKSVSESLSVPLNPVTTAYTLSLDEPSKMFDAATAASHRPVLKIKLGGDAGDDERLRAVRQGAPSAKLIVDANEGWTVDKWDDHLRSCLENKVGLIEQPFPAADDSALDFIKSPIPICADESAHTREGLEVLAKRYDAINIKLDKTGGLTEALALKKRAEELGMIIMVGCMVASSLAMAPAIYVAQGASWVDLDGPLLLAKDCENPLSFDESIISPPEPSLWG